jgi:hypothetical protein
MPSSTPRALTAVAVAITAAASIGLILAASSCDAPRHDAPHRQVPAANVVVVPNPEQVTGTIDTSGMDWLSRCVAIGSGAAGR